MTFTVQRKQLSEELALLQLAMERKSTIAALSTVRMEFNGEQLHLTTSDLDITLQTSIPASGDPFSGCLPCAQLHSLVRLMEQDEASFTTRPNGRVEVRCEGSKVLLPTYPITAFPATPEPCETPLSIGSTVLTTMLKSVRFSTLSPNGVVKVEDERFRGLQLSLKGGVFKVEATRKVTFATAEREMEGEEFSAIIPPSAVSAVMALTNEGSVLLGVREGFATFRHGDRILTTRLFLGHFPDFSGIIPEFTQRTVIHTATLTKALKRAMLTTDTNIQHQLEAIKLIFTASDLTIETKDSHTGKSDERITITSSLNGESITFGAFGQQLLEWLATAGEETIVELNAPTMVRLSQAGQRASYVVCSASLKW